MKEDYSTGLRIEVPRLLDAEDAQRVVHRVCAALEPWWVDSWFRVSASEMKNAIEAAEAGSLAPPLVDEGLDWE